MTEQTARGGFDDGGREGSGEQGRMAEAIVRELAPTSVLDVRSETGLLVEALHERGIEARRAGSLTEPPEGRYDLVICLDALERVPAAEAVSAIASLCAATDAILVSAAPSNGVRPGGLEAEPPAALAARLAEQGFLLDDRNVSRISSGASLYRRGDEPLAEVVGRYEREGGRLRRQLAERDHEIRRLRDLLVARDGELGKARGRLTEIEESSLRFAAATVRAHFGPRAMLARIVAALRRRLGGRTGP